MTALSTSPQLLRTFTERELYRLSWEISEELVRREQERLLASVAAEYVQDSADDNYGGW